MEVSDSLSPFSFRKLLFWGWVLRTGPRWILESPVKIREREVLSRRSRRRTRCRDDTFHSGTVPQKTVLRGSGTHLQGEGPVILQLTGI